MNLLNLLGIIKRQLDYCFDMKHVQHYKANFFDTSLKFALYRSNRLFSGEVKHYDINDSVRILEMKCYQSSDCPAQLACSGGKCKNPCETSNPCSPAEDCQVQKHEAVCVKGKKKLEIKNYSLAS